MRCTSVSDVCWVSAVLAGSDGELENTEMFNRPYEKEGRGMWSWQSDGKATGLWPSVRLNQICVPLSVPMCAKTERERVLFEWKVIGTVCGNSERWEHILGLMGRMFVGEPLKTGLETLKAFFGQTSFIQQRHKFIQTRRLFSLYYVTFGCGNVENV